MGAVEQIGDKAKIDNLFMIFFINFVVSNVIGSNKNTDGDYVPKCTSSLIDDISFSLLVVCFFSSLMLTYRRGQLFITHILKVAITIQLTVMMLLIFFLEFDLI